MTKFAIDTPSRRHTRRLIATLALALCGVAAFAQIPPRSSADITRDLLLSVPPIAKAGVFLTSTLAGIAGGNVDPYPAPFNLIAYALVGGIATTNIGVVVSGWADLPNATRSWRRAAFAVDAGALLFGTVMLIADIIQPDPSGSAAIPILGAMATFAGLMLIDTLPFSVETRVGTYP